jgi:hypothetical protein
VRKEGESKARMSCKCAIKTMHRCFFVAEGRGRGEIEFEEEQYFDIIGKIMRECLA